MDNPFLTIEEKSSINGLWQQVEIVVLKRVVDNKGIAYWKTYRIGRATDCEIKIVNSGGKLSRYQATLIRYDRDADYTIIDGRPNQPSTNGCWKNGVKIQGKVLLTHGDIILVAANIRITYFNEKNGLDISEITITSTDFETEKNTNVETN